MNNKKVEINKANGPRKKLKTLKRKRGTTIDLNAFQVPLNNQFNLLSEDDNMETEPTPKKDPKVSPIVVTDHSLDLIKLSNETQVLFTTKIVSIGRKIFVKTKADKQKIINALEAQKVNFFSHPDIDGKIFKVVLSGLPALNTTTIKDCLSTDYKLEANKITMFNTNSSNKLYLCEFDGSIVNLQKVKEAKTVYHHIVTWLAYKPKRRGPTLCGRCLMWGHGMKFCNRFAACSLCSGNHLTSACTVITIDTPNPTYKCFNCKSAHMKDDHQASDDACPFRAKYIATKMSSQNSNKRGRPTHNRNGVNTNERLVQAAAPPPLQRSFANILSEQTREPNNHKHTNSAASSSKSASHTNTFASTTTHINSGDSDLFSFAEVSKILFDSIQQLQQCKTKLDQLMVISNILQYACK